MCRSPSRSRGFLRERFAFDRRIGRAPAAFAVFPQNGDGDRDGSAAGGARPEVLCGQLFVLSAAAVHHTDHVGRGEFDMSMLMDDCIYPYVYT